MLTATQLVAGALLIGSRARRLIGVTVAFAAVGIPWLMPNDIPLLRAILALAIAMTFLRSIDLARENKPRSIWFRILHVAIPFDTRRMHRAPIDVRIPLLTKNIFYLALTIAAWRMIEHAGPLSLSNWPRVAQRWAAAAIFAYAVTDAAYGFVEFGFRAVGLDIYELHRTPAASLSVKEFWGDRWNRTVSKWLAENILKPLARRANAKLGAIGSFFVSAILHAYLVLVAATWKLALVMLGYFFLQGAFVMIEIALHENHWRRLLARAWTVTLLASSSPLFTEPLLRILGF
jgi:hypothetical protein